MNKDEFLKKMKEALEGQVSNLVIVDNIKYYKNYIETEIANGKSEISVLEMLGDPRLLAKTIIELQGTDNNTKNMNDINHSNDDYRNDDYSTTNQQEGDNYKNGIHSSKHHSFFGIKGCFVSIIILFIVFTILKFVLSAALYFALPICIILLFVWVIKRLR